MIKCLKILVYAFSLLLTQGAYGIEHVKLQLKWLHQFQFAGYYAAVQQGYYSEVGLEVELIEAHAGESPAQAVIEGDADYGIATTDIVRLRAQGEPVVALAVIFQHSPIALISTKEAGINTIHDLVGKRVMIQDGSADLTAMLQAQQIPRKSIEFVPHELSYDALINGTVSAFSGYITNEPYSLEAEGFTPVIFSPQSSGIDFYGDALFTTEEHIRKHPKQVEAFRSASLKGWEFALEHPDTVIEYILENYPSRKSKEQLQFEAEKLVSLIRPDLITIGHMNPTRWKHIAEILKGEGLISDKVDIEPMLYKYEKPFPWSLFLKTGGVLLFLICALLIFSRRQIQIKRRLEAEIQRRITSDTLLVTRDEEYKSMFEDAPLAFIVWDTSLKIREWNHAAESLFGWSADEVIGKVATDFLVPESAQKKVTQGKEMLMQKNARAQVNENYTKDGRVIWCQWHNTSRKNINGEVIEFHSIATDVTAEVYAQAKLDKEHAQAVHANHAKDVLLAQTSHEIRNPLNAIMGFTQMIIADAKDPETNEMAQIILDGAEGMLNILNDLLDASKIDAGKMEVEWKQTDLIKCVQQEAKLFSQLLRNKGLNCTLTVPDQLAPILTDERRILQILNNLINNAAKFTQQGEIRITLVDESPTHVAIRIRDTGIGMDDETLSRIFEPYAQASQQTSKEFGGTGLGLSLTKKLVELLQGQLRAESTPGTGSRFILLLPKQPKI